MKLGPLLAQFLYQHKRLDLPGMGSFQIDATRVTDSGKALIPGISFESNPAVKEDPDLIKYISEHSGKMKALASADFHSYLQLALQFLNIGKPFLFEGIGSLVKRTSGGFAFAPGETTQEDLKEYTAREISATTSAEESFNKYDEGKKKWTWKQPLGLLLILASLAIVIWGGYTLYNKTKDKEQQNSFDESNLIVTDSLLNTPDSITVQPTQSTHYKYVLEVAQKDRALERYAQLKSYQWKVEMETRDSVNYTLFMLLPLNAGDTSRIIDSLRALTGKPVYIEH